MLSNLTNLLPQEYLKTLKSEYWMRLATVAVYALVVVVLVNAVFLIPSYIYVNGQVATEQQALKNVSTTYPSADEQQVTQQLDSLSTLTSYLATLATTPTGSASIRAVLAAPHPGITLSSFAFTAPTKTAPGDMQVTGVADTREDLSSYNSALSALPFVTNANLPIGDYAQGSNISFTITLTGPFVSQ